MSVDERLGRIEVAGAFTAGLLLTVSLFNSAGVVILLLRSLREDVGRPGPPMNSVVLNDGVQAGAVFRPTGGSENPSP